MQRMVTAPDGVGLHHARPCRRRLPAPERDPVAAIAPFMSMRRTTSASVIQRPQRPSPRLRSCSVHGTFFAAPAREVLHAPRQSGSATPPGHPTRQKYHNNQRDWQTALRSFNDEILPRPARSNSPRRATADRATG